MKDWMLTEDEINNFELVDLEPENYQLEERDEGHCDLLQIAMNGDVRHFEVVLRDYRRLLYRKAGEKSDKLVDDVEYVDTKSKESRETMIEAINTIVNGSTESNRKILDKAVREKHTANESDAVTALSKATGSKFMKEMIKETDLPEDKAKRLSINTATTFTNLLKQVKLLLEPSDNVVQLQPRVNKSQATKAKVQEMKAIGMKQREVVTALGVSSRTVKRYWNEAA